MSGAITLVPLFAFLVRGILNLFGYYCFVVIYNVNGLWKVLRSYIVAYLLPWRFIEQQQFLTNLKY